MIEMGYKDIFIDRIRPNISTQYWVGFYFIITILFVVGFLQNPSITSFGLIYALLSMISLTFFALSVTTKDRYGKIVVYGVDKNYKKLLLDITVGLVVGIVLIGGYLGFSIYLNPSPFSITSSTSTINSLILLIVIGFFGVEAEEMFRASTLVPTLLNYIGELPIKAVIFAGLTIFSALFMFFFVQFLSYITLYIVAGMLFLALLIESFIKKYNKATPKAKILSHVLAILFGATVFMMLHVFAYGNGSYSLNINDYISAFAFAVIADSINWILQSTIASRISHSVNNSVLTASALSIPIVYAGMIVLLYIFFILTIGNPVSKNFRTLLAKDTLIGQYER